MKINQLRDLAIDTCDLFIEAVGRLKEFKAEGKKDLEVATQAREILRDAGNTAKNMLENFRQNYDKLRFEMDKRLEDEKTAIPGINKKDPGLQTYCQNLLLSQRENALNLHPSMKDHLIKEITEEYQKAVKFGDTWYMYFVEYYLYRKFFVYGVKGLESIIEEVQDTRISDKTRGENKILLSLASFYELCKEGYQNNFSYVSRLFEALNRADTGEIEILFRIAEFSAENPVYAL